MHAILPSNGSMQQVNTKLRYRINGRNVAFMYHRNNLDGDNAHFLEALVLGICTTPCKAK